jgi:uncharacterized membrane protein YsdA (DUF1294 family)
LPEQKLIHLGHVEIYAIDSVAAQDKKWRVEVI